MKIKRILFWLIPLLVVLGIAAVVAQKVKTKQQAEAAQKVAKAKAESLDTPKLVNPQDLLTSSSQTFATELPVTASIEASKSAVLKAKVGGQVLSAAKREGDKVGKGELLATLDSIDLNTRLAEREAVTAQAQAQLDTASRTLVSQRELFNKGFISANALETAEGNVQVLAAALKAAQAGVALAKQAQSDVRLLSPIDGVVGKRHVETGDRLMAEQAIYSIIDKRALELAALVASEDASKIKIGQRLNAKLGGQTLSAEVSRFAPQVAVGGARVVELRAKLLDLSPAQSEQLAIGSLLNGSIALGERQVSMALPLSALRAGNKVWLIKDNRIAEQALTLGERDEAKGMVEVLGGLAANSRVLHNKVQDLKLGQLVN